MRTIHAHINGDGPDTGTSGRFFLVCTGWAETRPEFFATCGSSARREFIRIEPNADPVGVTCQRCIKGVAKRFKATR